MTLKTVGTDTEEKPSGNQEKQLFQHNCEPHKGAQVGSLARHEGLIWFPRGLSDCGDSLRGEAQEGKSKNLALAYHCRGPRERGDIQMEIEEDY